MNKEQRKAGFLTLLPVTCYLLFVLSACASNSAVNNNGNSFREIPADIAGLVHAGETNSPEEYALLDRLGASWLLATFYWSGIEPSDDRWSFDSYDKYVDTARAAGKKVIGILAYDAPWIHPDGKSRRYVPPDKIHFYLDYVRQTAARFKGRVDAWCVWNEPNGHFWKGSKDEFFTLARLAADAVKEADPGVTLLGGAFNRGIFGLPKAYIRGLFESGAMEKADAVAFHPYELNPARTARLYDQFRAIVAEYGFADRIWVTEVGYPTGGMYPTATSEKKFPAFVVKTFVNLAAGGAQTVMWYQLFDPMQRAKSNSENFFGLVRSKNDYASKGAEAFRLCAAHLAGTTYRPGLPLRERVPGSLRAFCFAKPEGGGALVLWKEGSPAKVALRGLAGGFTVHDPVSGAAAEAPADTVLEVGAMPVFITWQGGGEELSALRIVQTGR